MNIPGRPQNDLSPEQVSESTRLLWVWLGCVLLPLPAILFWRSDYGRGIAIALFFVGCVNMVSFAFRGEANSELETLHDLQHVWRTRMLRLASLSLAAWAIFSVLLLGLSGSLDLVGALLALGSLIPALYVTPYFTMLTRSAFAATVFTLFTEFWMKLLGCIVVVLVYGWDASERGHTTMPWTQPNLLVWCFWFNTGVLSAWFYFLGKRRFVRRVNPGPDSRLGADPTEFSAVSNRRIS
jgi:hypothetical protein